MYVLYDCNGSGSAAIEAALDLAGARWRLVKAASWESDSNFEALLRVNPLGLVPTLVLSDASVLTESAAILMHLGDAHPASGLLPPSDASGRLSRSQAVRGLVFIAAHCYAAIGHHRLSEALVHTVRRGDGGAHPRRHARTAASQLGSVRRHVLLGALPVGRPARRARPSRRRRVAVVGHARASAKARPAFLDTLERVELHPRVAAVFARHWPPTS